MVTYADLSPDARDEADYLRQSVDIVPEGIREEFVRIPADLAYWGGKYAEAVRDMLTAEHDRKVTYAETRLRIRALRVAGGGKITEADLDAEVERDPGCRAAKVAEIQAEAAKEAARANLNAVAAKRDMLMSLGAHIRAEMGPSQLRG